MAFQKGDIVVITAGALSNCMGVLIKKLQARNRRVGDKKITLGETWEVGVQHKLINYYHIEKYETSLRLATKLEVAEYLANRI